MDRPVRRMDHMMFDANIPTSLVTITGMMVFEKKIQKDHLISIIENRLLKYSRFRERIAVINGKPYWHEDELFDISSHLVHVALPEPCDYNTLQDFVSHLISQPLDPNKALWKVHLIDNYKGGSVVIWRIHHAIADGIALIKVVFSLTGATAEESLKLDISIEDDSLDIKEKKSFMEAANKLFKSGKSWYSDAVNFLKDKEKVKATLSDALEISNEIGKLVYGKSADNPLYKGNLSHTKKAAFSDALPLHEIKKIGKYYGVTVNDILLAILTGSIRRHLLKHTQDMSKPIRIAVPVNMRKKGEKIEIKNKVGIITVELPVHLENIDERISNIKAKTELLKKSFEPLFIYYLMNAVGDIITPKMEDYFIKFFGTKLTGVMTNVPGPREAIYFAGEEVKDIMFWVPHTILMGIGISIISYNNRVCLGVVTDTNLVKNPDEIVEAFYHEFDDMKAHLGL